MNEHIRKGNEALEGNDLQAAKVEFTQALLAPDELTRRIAKNRLGELGKAIVLKTEQDHVELITPTTNSRCCNARAVFVRSREGGFVTQNCTRCGKSAYAHESDFPPAECCGKTWPLVIIDKNFHYRCEVCGRTCLVADILPPWSDLGPYSPLPAPGDPGWGAA